MMTQSPVVVQSKPFIVVDEWRAVGFRSEKRLLPRSFLFGRLQPH